MNLQDSEYLKATMGEPLSRCLTEVCLKQPADPIEFIAHWLFRERKRQDDQQKLREEAQQLMDEKMEFQRRVRRLAVLKAEAELFDILLRQSMEESGHLERGSPSYILQYFADRVMDDPEMSYIEEEENPTPPPEGQEGEIPGGQESQPREAEEPEVNEDDDA